MFFFFDISLNVRYYITNELVLLSKPVNEKKKGKKLAFATKNCRKIPFIFNSEFPPMELDKEGTHSINFPPTLPPPHSNTLTQ